MIKMAEIFSGAGTVGLALFVLLTGVILAFKLFNKISGRTALWLSFASTFVLAVVVIFLGHTNAPPQIPAFGEEQLVINLDNKFQRRHSFVYSVTRPHNKLPRVHQLGTWYRLTLKNQSNEPIYITKLSLIIDDQKTASDDIKGPFFDKLELAEDSIRFIGPSKYPIELTSKQYRTLYVAIPIPVPNKLGKHLLAELRDADSKIDSMIEMYLYSDKVVQQFAPIVTVQNDTGEQLVSGQSLDISQLEVAIERQCMFRPEGEAYTMLGYDKYDDGFRLRKTDDILLSVAAATGFKAEELTDMPKPFNKATLVASTSMDKEFRIDLKPNPSGLYLIQ